MAKLQILSAKPGVFRSGQFFKTLKRNSRRNAPGGFYDSKGVFHAVSEKPKKKRAPKAKNAPKKKKAKKRVAKKKPVKRKPTVKRAAKAKKKGKR